jgi:Ca-activated chloride channel family protein
MAVLALGLIAAVAAMPGAAAAITLSDRVHSAVEKGNKYYNKGEPDKALEAYREAQRHDSLSVIPQFNAGDALYKMGKYEEGAKEFTKTASASGDSISAMSYYNLGNSAFKAGDLRAAAEAYKKSLLIGPNDGDAKFNLEYALAMLKQQQQQQQQNQNKENQGGQNKEQQDQQGGQGQEQQQQQQQDQKSQAGEQQKQEEGSQSGQAGAAQGQMTPDELKRILAAIDASDRETQQELLKNAARTKHLTDKDW